MFLALFRQRKTTECLRKEGLEFMKSFGHVIPGVVVVVLTTMDLGSVLG